MRDPTAIPLDLANSLRGRRYVMTETFISNMRYLNHPPSNLICTIHDMHYNTDGRVMVGLRWPGSGVLVSLDDIADLVAL